MTTARQLCGSVVALAILLPILPSSVDAKQQTSCCRTLAPGPFAVGLEVGAGIGTYDPYGVTRLAFEARLWNRLDLSANLRLASSGQLLLVGPSFRAGVLLHLSRSADMLLAGEAGYGAMQLYLPLASPWVHQAVFRFAVELRFALPYAGWELRATPLGAAAFWSRIWGLVFEPVLGCAYRF